MSKTLILEITGPEQVLDAGVEAVARVYGYTDTIPDSENPGQEIPNPRSKTSYVRDAVRQFLRETAITYNIQIARQQASDQAAEQAKGALDLLELSDIQERSG